MRQWDVKANIGREAYRELYWFCRQYNRKKTNPQEGCNATDVRLIDDVAVDVAGVCASALVENVVNGTQWEHLDVPCGRRLFYDLRRKFFAELYHRKNG